MHCAVQYSISWVPAKHKECSPLQRNVREIRVFFFHFLLHARGSNMSIFAFKLTDENFYMFPILTFDRTTMNLGGIPRNAFKLHGWPDGRGPDQSFQSLDTALEIALSEGDEYFAEGINMENMRKLEGWIKNGIPSTELEGWEYTFLLK